MLSYLSQFAALIVALVTLKGVSATVGWRPEPAFPFDTATTKDCTWWYDSDGSQSCAEVVSEWGISTKGFYSWVRICMIAQPRENTRADRNSRIPFWSQIVSSSPQINLSASKYCLARRRSKINIRVSGLGLLAVITICT